MILSVLANRHRAGWGDWLAILDRIPLFSAELEQPTGTPNIWEPNFVRLLHEIESVYDGSMDYAKGALYWADLQFVDNPWFIDKILGNKEEHGICGNMNSLTLFK